MPQVFFNTDTFKGQLVSTTESSLRHARLLYETKNLCRMPLTAEEKRLAFGLLKRE